MVDETPETRVLEAADGALTHLQSAARRGYDSLTPLIEAVSTLRRERARPPEPVPVRVPVFAIKGSDQLALPAIDFYRDLCLQTDLPDQAEQVRLAFDEMQVWQTDHPELVKPPDHVHVPLEPRVPPEEPPLDPPPDPRG